MTDIDKVLADHRESTMPAWKGACAADGDDFPCLEYRLASELEAARKVVAAGRNIHAALIGAYGECPFCERYRGIGLKPCYLQSELAAYERVMEEQR